MAGMKDSVHTDYLKSLEAKRSLPELKWDDRVVLVVGSDGSANVGATIATFIAQERGRVIESDRRDSSIENLEHIVRQTTDLVVCCASVHLNWIEDASYSDIEQVVFDSLTVPIMVTKMFADAHRDTPHRKHIVYIGSMAYRKVLNASATYCAAKAGLAHFAQCAAWELTPKGFTVGVVHPGNIQGTPMTEDTIKGIAKYRNLDMGAAYEYWSSVKLTERWLIPEDVARQTMHLLQSSPHMSGTQIELGGGLR